MECARGAGGGAAPTAVGIELELRVVLTEGTVPALAALAEAGGDLRGCIVYRLGDRSVGLFLCEKPTEAALALEEAGIPVETETVVTVATGPRTGLLARLVQTLAAENIAVGYAYGTTSGGDGLLVMRTDNNPKAEDVIRNLLVLPEP
jgi:hypothetical protein